MRRSLQLRLFAIMGPIVLAPLLVLGVLVWDRFEETIVSRAERAVRTLLQQGAGRLDDHLRTVRSNLHLLSRTDVLAAYLTTEDPDQKYRLIEPTLIAIVDDFLSAQADLARIAVLSPERSELVAVDRYGDMLDFSAETGSGAMITQLGDPPMDGHVVFVEQPPSGKPTFVGITPVTLRNRRTHPYVGPDALIGYLVARLDPDALRRLIQPDQGTATSGDLVFVTDAGRVIQSSVPEIPASSTLPDDVVSRVLRHGTPDGVVFVELSGVPFFVQGRRVAPDLCLIAALPAQDVLDERLSVAVTVAGLVAVTIGLILGVALPLIHRILVRPIKALRDSAARIGDGDLVTPVPVRSATEIGELAQAVETMRRNLRASQELLMDSNADLRRQRNLAEEANAAKSRFLASMSHELRTPLNAVLGFGEFLESSTDPAIPERYRGYVRHIVAAGRHLLDLISRVLDMAKIEAGDVQMALEAVDPRPVIDDCLRFAQALPEAAGLRFEDRTTGRALPVVRGDHTAMRQVLLNLLSNAVKYNRAGGAVGVDFGHTTDRDGTAFARFEVTDTGSGLPDDLHDEVFEPFNRLGREASDIAGTGIGLTVSRSLVEHMGGRIGFESRAGTGSRFWFDLPLAASCADGPEGRPPAAGRASTGL